MEQQQQWRVFTLTKGRRNKREFVPNKFEKKTTGSDVVSQPSRARLLSTES